MGIDFAHYGSESGYTFHGIVRSYKSFRSTHMIVFSALKTKGCFHSHVQVGMFYLLTRFHLQIGEIKNVN